MDANKVDQFLMMHGSKFPIESIPVVRERLEQADTTNTAIVMSLDFKDPTITLILSIFLGGLGIDRFFIGDIGLGIGKLLTGGGCGVWTIIDWFLIMTATRKKNLEKLLMYVH